VVGGGMSEEGGGLIGKGGKRRRDS
jgi:hypothetical protein